MMHDAQDTQGGCTHNVTQMKGHTQEGGTLTVLPIERTQGTHPQCNPMNGHTYFHRGGDAPTM